MKESSAWCGLMKEGFYSENWASFHGHGNKCWMTVTVVEASVGASSFLPRILCCYKSVLTCWWCFCWRCYSWQERLVQRCGVRSWGVGRHESLSYRSSQGAESLSNYHALVFLFGFQWRGIEEEYWFAVTLCKISRRNSHSRDLLLSLRRSLSLNLRASAFPRWVWIAVNYITGIW